MDFLKRHSKRIVIDIAGFSLLLLVPFLGPLPGPGGVPLILAALGLLSINHAWARRLRDALIANGSRVAKIIFPDNRTIQILYDIFAVILVISVVLMLRASTSYMTLAISSVVTFSAGAIFYINRQRGTKITEKLTAKIRKP